jgi:hypothetical protein
MPQWRWCIVCWKEFLPYRKSRLYCSPACKQKVYRVRKAVRDYDAGATPANGNKTATQLQHET